MEADSGLKKRTSKNMTNTHGQSELFGHKKVNLSREWCEVQSLIESKLVILFWFFTENLLLCALTKNNGQSEFFGHKKVNLSTGWCEIQPLIETKLVILFCFFTVNLLLCALTESVDKVNFQNKNK